MGRAVLEPDVTRIAYICAEYPKVSHTFVMREVDALRRRGLDVDTFTVRRTPPAGLLSDADRAADRETFAILPPDPARLVRAHARWLARNPARYLGVLRLALGHASSGRANPLWRLFYFAEAVLLADELRRRRIDHVHAHFVNVASAVAMLATALRGPGATWSFTMHGPLEFDDVRLHAIPDKVRRARFVACISDYCRAQLMRQVEPEYWERLHVVRCGVEPARYGDSSAGHPDGVLTARTASVPSETGLRPPGSADSGFHIVSVGRLAPMKGFSVLLEALAELDDARLTLVGDGPERAALEATARRLGLDGRVRFTGALGADAVGALLREADVFCLPSFAEGVPVVLMEAMAARVPVVSTGVMGIPELVADGQTGRLVAPGRPGPLAAALRELAADPAERARMGARGRAAIEAGFDVDRSAAELARLFGHANGAPAGEHAAATAMEAVPS
jgi:glycosyltransferase involved in cell wall biosynthesis